MVKKVAIGCLSIFVLLSVAGAGVFYVFIWRPARNTLAVARHFADIQRLETQVQNRSSYQVPEDGLLQAEQVARFVRVQRSLLASLEDEYQQLQSRYQGIEERGNVQNVLSGYRALLELWGDIANTLLTAKRAQVEALNREGFSLSEYHWVRIQAYNALDYQVPTIDWRAIVAAQTQGNDDVAIEFAEGNTSNEILEHNRSLVAPYRELLEQSVGLAFFGL